MSPGLVQFLYVLLRDRLPAGDLEEIVRVHVEKARAAGPGPVTFSNPHLEAYARELAARIEGPTSD